jgi:hypothetical protein
VPLREGVWVCDGFWEGVPVFEGIRVPLGEDV